MLYLLKVFLDICLLRAGPQDLPASHFLMWLALALHALLGVVFALFTLPLGQALLAAATGTALLLLAIQIALTITYKPERRIQTVTALAGSELLLGLLALLPTVWFYSVDGAQARLLPSLLSLLFIVWGVVVTGHILRHALAISQAFALMLALAYTLFSYSLMGTLFPY